MKAIIIAAGSGTRLDNLQDTPKSLIDINGKTILERQIEILRNNNINEIIVITGPNNHKFNFKNIHYVQDNDYSQHDILCSLMAARNFFNSDIFISYSDILYDDKIIKEIISTPTDYGIAIDQNWRDHYEGRINHPESEAENVLIRNDKVIKIKKNINSENPYDIIGEFLGIMKLSKKGCSLFLEKFNQLESSHKGKFHNSPSLQKAYLTDMIQELIDSKINIEPILITGKWCEIDTQQDLEKARQLFR